MSFCHECGEQVANEDVFCPYCGISLNTAPPVEDLSMSETIVGFPPPPMPVAEEPKVTDNAGLPENPPVFEAPIPPPLSPFDEIPEVVAPTPEIAAPEIAAPAIAAPEMPVADIAPVPEIVAEISPADEVESFEPSESAVFEKLFAEDEAVSEETPVAAVEPIAEEAVPEVVVAEEVVAEEVVADVAQSEAITAESPAYDDEPVAETPEEVAAPLVEAPIAMPEKALLLEAEEPAPKYDSVQIIEKKVAEMAGEQGESKESRSYTTPNIGGPDTDGRKSAKLQPLEEGTVLNGRYEIVRKIGGGGMGAVYLANDRNLGGVLRAVKEMVQSYIESEQQDKAVNDFKRESLLLTSLDHPAIPTIYDYFFDEKEARFYLVMRYISGGDLAGRLRAAPEGKIDEKSVTEWAIQIADVLEYLHKHEPPIVYRDLKPANVMIDGNSGRVMLIDFGIARWVNKEEKGVTAVGTMGYAPPELFSGNVEARSDIYSLGSTMFHLLTGADPQSNPLLIFDFQKNPRPRQINSTLSDQIEQILMRSVEYNADLRFRSAAEMRDALKDHLANLTAGRVTFGIKAAPSNRAFSEQPVFCGFCGKQIVATDVFCAFCGAQQPLAQQAGAAAPVAVQPLVAKLTIMATGDLEPSMFRLEKNENLLGRRDPMSNIFPEVDLSKFDPQTKISRRHARIWRDGHGFLVEDLGSSNGTTLIAAVGEPVRLLPHQPHTLTGGDRIKLGDTLLHFTIG